MTGRLNQLGPVPMVNLSMPLIEFKEWVELMERHFPNDGATQDMRDLLDQMDPPIREEEDDG